MNNQEKNTYVRRKLSETLTEMLKEKKLEEISVKELCAEAQVARASFYRNYHDTEDILQQECERLMKAWGKAFEADPLSSPSNVFGSLFQHYYEHKNFYTVLVQAGKEECILRTMQKQVGPRPEMPDQKAYEQAFFTYGLYGWTVEWIRRGMQENGKELNAMITHPEKTLKNR